MKTCPFEDPEYVIPIETPCPVCGMTGFEPLVEDKCVGMGVVDTGDDLHQILGEALKAARTSR